MRPLLFGVFARALPLTMFGPLLPGIASSLGATLAGVGWIVATYATGSLLAQPLMGTLSDALRRRRARLPMVHGALRARLVRLLCRGLQRHCRCSSPGASSERLGAGGIQPVAAAIIGDALPA